MSKTETRQKATKRMDKTDKTLTQKKKTENIDMLQRKTGTWRKHEARVQHEEGHSIKRVWYAGSREPSDTPPDHNYLAFAPKGIASTSLNSQGFRLLYQHRRRCLGSPWVGLIKSRSETSQAWYGHPRCSLPCPPLPLFSFYAIFRTPFPLPSPTRP